MALFRKKPVVIEAEQWFPYKQLRGVSLVPREPHHVNLISGPEPPYGVIATLEGQMIAMPGDWIITGVKGEKYPCKPDIFAATYEAVD